MHISFESSKVNSIIDKHQSNLELLQVGELRLNQLDVIRSLYSHFAENGFLNLIAYVGYANFFSVLKSKILVNPLSASDNVLYDILTDVNNEFHLPDDVVVMMIYSLSRDDSESRSFDYSLLTKDVLELMESIIIENPLFCNLTIDLLIQSLLVDVKKELHFQAALHLRDVYSELVFFKKLYQSLYSLSSLDALISNKEVFNINDIPVINILGYYRNQYLKFLKGFKLNKTIVFR
ncbi:hypothetical protein CL656_02510 [bacterium]|nr:hypothetical protein [bacterium]